MTDAERIAGSLTKAQREALALVPDNQRYMNDLHDFGVAEGDIERLHDLGIIARWPSGTRACWINHAGLAVRAVIEKEQNDAAKD